MGQRRKKPSRLPKKTRYKNKITEGGRENLVGMLGVSKRDVFGVSSFAPKEPPSAAEPSSAAEPGVHGSQDSEGTTIPDQPPVATLS